MKPFLSILLAVARLLVLDALICYLAALAIRAGAPPCLIGPPALLLAFAASIRSLRR